MVGEQLAVLFRGSNAAASLKQRGVDVPRDLFGRLFRGSNAAASLKLSSYVQNKKASVALPRQ